MKHTLTLLTALLLAVGFQPLVGQEESANTIIVLWSDHGWHLGQKQHWSKFALWEQATRAPFLIVAPGVTKPDQRCSAPVSLLDIYPTLMELCGLPRPKEIEGTSLVPLLKDPAAPRAEPAVMTWGPNSHAVRDIRWRYIRYADGSEELYDHQNDPCEWTNLASSPEHNETKHDSPNGFQDQQTPHHPHPMVAARPRHARIAHNNLIEARRNHCGR